MSKERERFLRDVAIKMIRVMKESGVSPAESTWLVGLLKRCIDETNKELFSEDVPN